jgi:hypothetical protein
MDVQRLLGRRRHLRGLHYVVLGEAKPNGTPYTNTDEDWTWLQSKAGKAARWLGYVPFEQITDERNAEPVVRLHEPPEPRAMIDVGGVEVYVPEDLAPEPQLEDFRGVQPYKLVLFGEKTSLEDVLAPIAEAHHADLYLPTGEASDTMIYEMAPHRGRGRAPDGRLLPERLRPGWMADGGLGLAQAPSGQGALVPQPRLRGSPIALTVEQVREYGLPSTPLKETEKRADRWEKRSASSRRRSTRWRR